MLPKLSHPDVYILGLSKWLQDVDCTNFFPTSSPGFISYTKENAANQVTLTDDSMDLYLDVVNSPDYTDYGFTNLDPISSIPKFTVYHINKHLGQVNIVEGYADTLEISQYRDYSSGVLGDLRTITNILSFGTSPDQMKSFRTHVITDTASAVIEAKESSFRNHCKSCWQDDCLLLG